ncbi:MAG: Flp pilus assembly complex ATPase component TadA [Patescibacteria group bacterium]|nr:Flp pilus assembly complex ATPase component TadA [Patescibacteria group bacterium]
MTVKDYNLLVFQERENFHGKKERLVLIDCKKCPKYTGAFLKTKRCVSCFLNSLYKIKRKKFDSFSLKTDIIYSLRKEKNDFFLEYFKKIKNIKNYYKPIDLELNQECIKNGMKCDIFSEFYSVIRPSKINYNNPIELYNIVQMRYNLVKKNEINNVRCFHCKKEMLEEYNAFLVMINEFNIIKDYRNFCKKNNVFHTYLEYYKALFNNSIKTDPTPKLTEEKETPAIKKEKPKLINSYKIGDYNIFKILMYDMGRDYEKLYEVNLLYETEEERGFFRGITKDVREFLIEAFKLDSILTFEELIDKYLYEGITYLADKYKLTKSEQERISLLATFEAINLSKLFPFLIDDKIEEIFLDSSESYIYINHQTYGRCRTDLKFKVDEIERLKTFIRLYSGERLDYANPSIKFTMRNKYFFCRFTIDIAPIHASSFSFDIRKLNKNILNIQDLLQNNTLNPLIASFLYFNILRRNNITVTGETDTGKTTLINALDLLLPKEFRKIYIENAIESLNQEDFGKHQLKYKVDSLEDDIDPKYSKSNQIKKLLHRSPDTIYLGEILEKEEAEALFHCLSAGLRGFQTIHADNIESLVNRFRYHFKIDPSCFNDLDLIILMKKDFDSSARKIIQIAEITSADTIGSLFIYDPFTEKWDSVKGDNLYECKSVQKHTKHEKLDEETFWRFLNIYKRVFEVFTKYDKIPNKVIVDFFHDFSSISKYGLDALEKFWCDWKRDCNIET